MFSSGLRRALAIARNASSSSIDPPTDESLKIHTQQPDDSYESLISDDCVLLPWSSGEKKYPGSSLDSSRGKQQSALHPSTSKLLPGIPGQSSSSASLPEGMPQLTYTNADSTAVIISSHSSDPLLDTSLRSPPDSKPIKPTAKAVSNDDASPTSSNSNPTEDAESPGRRKLLLHPLQRTLPSSESNANVSSSISNPDITQEPNTPPINKAPNTPDSAPLRPRRSNASFHPFLHKLAVISITETESLKPLSETQSETTQDHPSTNSRPEWFPSNSSTVTASPKSTTASPSTSPSLSEADEQDKARRRKRPQSTFSMLQPIVESGDNVPFQPKPSKSSFSPSILGLDSSFAKKMEETGRLRRLQSQNSLNSSSTATSSPLLPQTPVKSPPPPQTPKNSTAHSKAQSEGDSPQGPSPKRSPLASPPRPSVNGQAKGNTTHQEDKTFLQDLLDRTLRELKEAKEETARVKAQSDREKALLVQQLKVANEEVLALKKESLARNAKIISLSTQLNTAVKGFREITQEKDGWQEQLDTMHHRLIQAERQVRSLDQLTRSKLEARNEGVYGPTKRSQKAPQAKEPSLEVINAVGALNEEILQTANLLVENLERTKTMGTADDVTRSKAVLGNKVTSMMQTQANDHSKGFRFLLMQVVLEVFMVHWSTNIIEAWYPPQKSFADLLIEMTSKTAVNAFGQAVARVDCGKVKILQTDSNATVTAKFPEWVVDVIKDLNSILSVAGLRIRPNRAPLFTSKLLTLVKIAYDVRTALAEKDICGGLELSVVGPDMPFQAKWMDEAHALSRNKVLTMVHEPIAGTSGMGLRSSTPNPVVVLKPKVVLARVLEESP